MTAEEANAIRCELQSIQQSLAVGEHEKTELMKNLACLKDDLTRLQHSDSSLDVSSASAAAAGAAAGKGATTGGGGRRARERSLYVAMATRMPRRKPVKNA